MKIDVVIYVVLFVLLVAFMSYKWFVKKEKKWCKDVLIKLQKMAEDYFGTKAGQQKLKTVLEKMNGIIDKRLAHSSSFTRWIIKKALNEYVVKKLIEENMDEVNKYGTERKEKELVKSAIDFGIKKGTELLIKEAYNHDVGGNKELTHETQLMTIAQDLNVQAKDKGFVGAYAEFETNFKEEKRLSAGITAGMKFYRRIKMYKPKYFTELEMRIDVATPEHIKLNAYNVAEKVMDPLREFIKKPITVNSWYRNPQYNKQVGGAKNSQHTLGEAVDFVVKGMIVEEIYAIIIKMKITFDQLILEYGNGTTWVHISLKRVGTNRQEVLKAVKTNGKWNYTKVK